MAGPTLILAPDDHSGRRLGKYEILCRLSLGGMSEIFLAFQRGLAGFRKFVVLKQILPDIKGEEEFVRMFLDEARITAAFAHPNIAQVFDLDIADGELFLAMEFVPGATLVEVARACRQHNEPIPIGFTLAAVRDTALALHYAHTFTDPMGRAVQVIHRDIAEKNIMVTYDGTTKLLDFGIAKALGRASRTNVGMVKGTSGYMSPEQILGEPLDPRSDLFSLGVVLHECLTGMRLFHAKKPEDAMMQAIKADVAPPSRTNPNVPRELDAVVLKALQRARDDRYATALEFARAIERVAAPLIWHAEQNAQFITRLFSDRRDQTRALMSQASSVELTGEIKLARLLSGDDGALVTDPMPPEELVPAIAPVVMPPPLPPALPSDAPAPPASPTLRRTGPRAAERRAEQVEVSPAVTAPPRRRPRPVRDPEATRPSARMPVRRTVTPPPPPVPDDHDHDLDDYTLPGHTLPPDLGLDRTHPAVRVTLPDEEGKTLTGVGENVQREDRRRRADAGLFAGLLTVAALLAVVLGIGWVLGLHEDLGSMLGLTRSEETTQATPVAAPVPVPVPAPQAVAVAEVEPSPSDNPLVLDALSFEEAPAVVAVQETPPAPPVRPATTATKPAARPRPQRAAASAPVVPADPKDLDAAWGGGKAGSEPVPEPAPAPVAAPAPRVETKQEAAPGSLTLITEPWSTVFLGARELGITPMVRLELAAGRHTLRLVGADGKTVALPVEIKPGEETKVRVPLSMLEPL